MILKSISKSRLVLDTVLMKLFRRKRKSIALVRVVFFVVFFYFFTMTGTAETSEHWVGVCGGGVEADIYFKLIRGHAIPEMLNI